MQRTVIQYIHDLGVQIIARVCQYDTRVVLATRLAEL